VWSADDIKTRLHSEIRSVISEQKESEISRAIQGRLLGMHTLTAEESANIALFKQVSDKVALLAVQARDDVILLRGAMALGVAHNRLALPKVALPAPKSSDPATSDPAASDPAASEPSAAIPVTQKDVDADILERNQAQAVITAGTPAATALHFLRHPVVVVEKVASPTVVASATVV